MSGKWFSLIIFFAAVYILAMILFRPKPPSNRYETLAFMDRMRQAKELNRILYMCLKIGFWFLVLILVSSAVQYYYE